MSLRKLRPFLLAFVFLLGSAVLGACTSLKQSASAPEVVSSDFGLFYPPDSEKLVFLPSRTVPLVPDQAYGWIIHLRTDKPKITWREEFVLPAKPATWGYSEPADTRHISADGRTTITERTVTPEDGVISHVWTVAPGDPEGRYVIRVFVENSLAATFGFDVKSDPEIHSRTVQ